jgi:hypothetical protein
MMPWLLNNKFIYLKAVEGLNGPHPRGLVTAETLADGGLGHKSG